MKEPTPKGKSIFEPVKFTQRLTLHLNGGSKYSELHYEIFANSTKTGITRHTRTDGSPKYLIVADEMHFGEETFDFLKDEDAVKWLMDRYSRKPQ